MYTKAELDKRDVLTRIVSVVVIVACVITLFSPWVHIGLRTDGGGMIDLNSLLELVEGNSVDDLVNEIMNADITDFIYDEVISKTARKDLSTLKKAVTKIASVIKDSKLSPVETATVCSKILKVQSFLSKYTDGDILGDATTVIRFSGIILWGLIWTFVALSLYCVFCALTSRKMPLIPAMCIYYLLFAIYLILSVIINSEMKESLGDGFMMELMRIKSASVLHIQFAPILGCILFVAHFIFCKLCPEGMGKASIADMKGSISDFGKKMVWKCSCGATNPTNSKFCPRCGESRPAGSRPIDLKADVVDRLVWTCACGSVNPKKSTFCPKCGTMRPSSVMTPETPAPPTPPVTSRCRMCGKSVAEGRTLCRECRIKMTEYPPATHDRPEVKPARETEAAGESRVKKTLKPPTALD